MNKKVSIILPCLNEWKRIFHNIEFLNLYLEKYLTNMNYEFILVNDGSTDNTKDEIERLAQKYSFVETINYRVNMWKGFAINKWLQKANGEIIVFYDSDLDIEPDSLVKHILYLEKNKKYSIVIWSKVHGKSKIRYSLKRKIISKFNIYLNKILFWLPVKDTQTWLKVFRKELKNTFLENIKIFWYAFDIEFLYHIYKKNYKIKELPVRVNLSSSSSVNFLSIINYLKEVVIFHKKISFIVSRKKITFITKLKLLLIKSIVFPIENGVNFILYILMDSSFRKGNLWKEKSRFVKQKLY